LPAITSRLGDFFFRILAEPSNALTIDYFKAHIESALKQIFGEIGGQTTVDILKFDADTQKAIVRVPSKYYVKVRASLCMIGSFTDIPCYFKVNSASPDLLGLLATAEDFD
jgi:ribonuclease P protein subunit RPP14